MKEIKTAAEGQKRNELYTAMNKAWKSLCYMAKHAGNEKWISAKSEFEAARAAYENNIGSKYFLGR